MTKCNNCNRQIEDWVTGDLCARCFGELEREKLLEKSLVKLVDVITYDDKIVVAVFEHEEPEGLRLHGNNIRHAINEISHEIEENYEMDSHEVRLKLHVHTKELNHIHWEDLAGMI